MKKSIYKPCFLVLLFLVIYTKSQSQEIRTMYYEKIRVERDSIMFDEFNCIVNKNERIGVKDLDIIPNLADQSHFYTNDNFRVYLLKHGYAKIRNVEKAKLSEVAFQNRAKSEKLGIWSEEKNNTDNKKEDNVKPPAFVAFWKKYYDTIIKAVIGILFGGGVVKILYKKFFIERQVRLLIIGEPTSGKSALYNNLINPNVSGISILELGASTTVNKSVGVKIPRGKFEIIPDYTDVPGSQYSLVWDNYFSKPHAIVFVASPKEIVVRYEGDGKVKIAKPIQNLAISDYDERYVDIQLGVLKAYLGALGSKSLKSKKPKVFILFISKFDVYSDFPPGDSSSREIESKFLKIFEEHIRFAKTETKKANVPFKLIIGSSYKKWNVNDVLEVVTHELYKN